MDVFNELCILSIAFMQIPISDYLNNPLLKYDVGWFVTFVFFMNLFLNILIIIFVRLIAIFKAIKAKLRKNKMNKTKKAVLE